jgi:CheY-like chemotaxis protein
MVLLCIDDDPDDIELIQDALRMIDKNYTCVIANSGCDGLKMLDRITPDYIFLDMNMPVMDGKETLKHIRGDRRFNSIPVCILSTYVNKTDADTLRMLGATKCLEKPNTFLELISCLKGVFDEKRGG